MDALDQQLLTRRIDRIEHKIDRLIELLTPPRLIVETFRTEPDDLERLRKELREDGYRPLIMEGEPRVEYIGPVLQAEDFEDV